MGATVARAATANGNVGPATTVGIAGDCPAVTSVEVEVGVSFGSCDFD